MKLLHVDSSITGPISASRALSNAIVQAFADQIPGLQVIRRDLAVDPLPHLDGRLLAAAQPGVSSGDPTLERDVARGAEALQEFLDADIVVVGAPMYNFSLSSQLKAWIDRLLIAGKTFRYTESGAVGLAGGKTVVVASARGGLYGPGMPQQAQDFQETYLRAVFGFIGIDDVEIVRAEGLAFGPEQREAALRAAVASAASTVAGLATAQAA